MAQMYLQPHYGNEVFSNVYLSAGQHKEVNIAGTPFGHNIDATRWYMVLNFESVVTD